MPFNIPNELISQEIYTGCPPGYTLVGDACVNNTTGKIYHIVEASEYEFEYYEIGGELIGRYKFNILGEPEAPPLYFSQNVALDKISNLDIDNPSQIINPEEGLLISNLIHNYNGGSPELLFDSTLTSNDPDYENTFLFGEFFLLPNNIASIKRINFNYDIVQDGKVFNGWANKVGTNDFLDLTQEELQPLVDLYIGYSRIPSKDRPEEMMVDESGTPATPTIANKIIGTDRLKWKTLRDSCFKWTRVYDKYSLNEHFLDSIPTDGQYILQFKAVINKDRVEEFINSNTDSSIYVDGSMKYKMLFYPPSIYMYPADTISRTISPKINAINNSVDEIIFNASNNYKTDGNVHYMIEFLTAKNSGDILFRTSSYGAHDYSEGFQWYESDDLESWTPITTGMPSFMNSFDESNGSDSEQTKYIKYILSDDAKTLLEDAANILFRIKQIDGTLIA